MKANLPPHYKRLAHGAASFVPPLYAALLRSAAFVRSVRGTPTVQTEVAPPRHGDSPQYCYNVWLRHLIYAHKDGLNDRPETVVEIGPGDSLGVGLAALISGSDCLHAIDPAGQPIVESNIAVFDELAAMFKRREPASAYNVRGRTLNPLAGPYDFPHHVLDDARLEEVLAESRLNAVRDSIEQAITQRNARTHAISYYTASGVDLALLPESSVDMVFSQHTLEHIEDLPRLFRAIAYWLKPGGHTSHIVNFDSHGAAETWDGHWAWSELHWKLLCGRPASPTERARNRESINREPLSAYLDLLTQHGFETRRVERETVEPTLPRRRMAPKFRGMSEADRTTRVAYIQARKM